jgi:hypothetical protein
VLDRAADVGLSRVSGAVEGERLLVPVAVDDIAESDLPGISALTRMF